jgi:hypothetical protein
MLNVLFVPQRHFKETESDIGQLLTRIWNSYKVQWNFLGQTAAWICEGCTTFRELIPSLSSGCSGVWYKISFNSFAAKASKITLSLVASEVVLFPFLIMWPIFLPGAPHNTPNLGSETVFVEGMGIFSCSYNTVVGWWGEWDGRQGFRALTCVLRNFRSLNIFNNSELKMRHNLKCKRYDKRKKAHENFQTRKKRSRSAANLT